MIVSFDERGNNSDLEMAVGNQGSTTFLLNLHVFDKKSLNSFLWRRQLTSSGEASPLVKGVVSTVHVRKDAHSIFSCQQWQVVFREVKGKCGEIICQQHRKVGDN